MSQGHQQGHQQGHRAYIGEGTITEANIRSEKSFMEKMTKLGVDNDTLNVILYTILPKGHADYMNTAQAIKKFCPDLTPGSVVARTQKALRMFLTELLHGQKAHELAKAMAGTEKEQSTRKKKSKIALEDRARIMAEKEISLNFRMTHKLPARGAIRTALSQEYADYLDKHIVKLIAKYTKLLGGTPVENKPQGQLVASA